MNNNNIKIRKAEPGDLQTVYLFICELENEQLEHEPFREIFEENLRNPDCLYYLAEKENKAVGFISFHIQRLLHHCGPVGEIQEFYVHPEFRNKGIGRLLMDEVKRHAEARNVKSIEVTSNKKRTANVMVYESLGFKLTHNKFTISPADPGEPLRPA